MDNKQLDEFLTKQNFSITLFPTPEKKEFKSVKSFENFINGEMEFWKDITSGILSNIRAHFENINNQLIQIKIVNDEIGFKNYFSQIKAFCNNHRLFISSETEEAQLLKKLYKQNVHRGEAAYTVLIDNQLSFQSDFNRYIGFQTAIDFKSSKETFSDKDKETLEQLGVRYQKTITEIRNEFDEINTDFDNVKSKYNGELNSINELIKNSNLQFTTDLDKNNKEFSAKMDEYQAKIVELEKTYGEKLRLEKPVEYWEELKTNYKKQGWLWTGWSIGISSVFILLLVLFLYFFPDWLKGIFHSDQLKGLIIFTLIVSTFTYLLHLFIKLANSAFHLSRDAEERKQLTHVYLALLKDKGIDESERAIILQSLFSRADTGLLKNDGTPAMPLSASMIESLTKFKR